MRTRILVPAVAALCLAGAGVASAAEAPAPTTIDVAQACGTVTLTFRGPAAEVSGVHGFRWNAVYGDEATDRDVRTGTVRVAPGQVVKETIRFDEDEYDGTAAVTVAVYFGPNGHLQPRLDIYPVDTDCRPSVVETTTPSTTTPATSTPATTTPATTTTPGSTANAVSELPDALLYETCADARTAGAAPIGRDEPGYTATLDADGDGVACETSPVGTVPVGSIATGA